MAAASAPDDVFSMLQLVTTSCQICTPLIAAAIAVVTFRYTKRQSALALINHNNSLANLVNQTIITSQEARATLDKLHNFIVGCPDDAVLFMYLNYVHNTYRMHRIGAVSAQVWRDTLGSCIAMMRRLRREQVVLLLARGYETQFQVAVLRCFDDTAPDDVVVLRSSSFRLRTPLSAGRGPARSGQGSWPAPQSAA